MAEMGSRPVEAQSFQPPVASLREPVPAYLRIPGRGHSGSFPEESLGSYWEASPSSFPEAASGGSSQIWLEESPGVASRAGSPEASECGSDEPLVQIQSERADGHVPVASRLSAEITPPNSQVSPFPTNSRTTPQKWISCSEDAVWVCTRQQFWMALKWSFELEFAVHSRSNSRSYSGPSLVISGPDKWPSTCRPPRGPDSGQMTSLLAMEQRSLRRLYVSPLPSSR